MNTDAQATDRAATRRGRRPLLQLPMGMVDFDRRGFQLHRPQQRAVLEEHGRNFLTGYNLAAANWRDVHTALAGITADERGFGYEGAAMFAAQRELVTGGLVTGGHSLVRLLAGPGDRYVHLIHVGAGWALAPVRLPLIRLPRTPLLRWLAQDGAGFAEVFFGGLRALARRLRHRPGPRWEIQVAGCGRALWWVTSADVDQIGSILGRAPAAARPALWSGVGLAAGYAGAVTGAELDRLREAGDQYRGQLAQGAIFAVASRARAGELPSHTRLACEHLVPVDPATAIRWADETDDDLIDRLDAAAYLEWKNRLARLATDHA